jgi:hypothetical protein
MTLFDRVLRGLERWREAVDRERDRVARLIALHGPLPLLTVLLDELELERTRVGELFTRLAVERHDPALLFSVRPRRVLKVTELPPRGPRARLEARR